MHEIDRVPASSQPTRGMCIVTRCQTMDELVEKLAPYCDETTLFASTKTLRPIGSRAPLAILLADKTIAFRATCVVRDSWSTADNPYGRPGMKLGIERLATSSKHVFARMLAARTAAVESGRGLRRDTQNIVAIHAGCPPPPPSPYWRESGGTRTPRVRPIGAVVVPSAHADTDRIVLPRSVPLTPRASMRSGEIEAVPRPDHVPPWANVLVEAPRFARGTSAQRMPEVPRRPIPNREHIRCVEMAPLVIPLPFPLPASMTKVPNLRTGWHALVMLLVLSTIVVLVVAWA